jgi:hypothetical protein
MNSRRDSFQSCTRLFRPKTALIKFPTVPTFHLSNAVLGRFLICKFPLCCTTFRSHFALITPTVSKHVPGVSLDQITGFKTANVFAFGRKIPLLCRIV